ncbi:hypothetical protein ABW21_db0208994 [Orbilia brochopaga]|nr:hypothetical protein ABW21_db0208994 [Drechslerella brochopaga]
MPMPIHVRYICTTGSLHHEHTQMIQSGERSSRRLMGTCMHMPMDGDGWGDKRRRQHEDASYKSRSQGVGAWLLGVMAYKAPECIIYRPLSAGNAVANHCQELVRATANSFGIRPRDLSSVVCLDRSIVEFAAPP